MTCPHSVRIIAPITLEENGKRTLLAEVDYCPKRWEGKERVGCDKAVGEPRRTEAAPKDFATGWMMLKAHHPWSPFVLERVDGFLRPLGVKIEVEQEREEY